MTDPVTFGALTVQALAWIGTEIAKTTVGEATKEAIKTFKQVFAHTGGAELVALEADPSSQDKQRALVQKIDAQPDERENLRAAFLALAAQIKAEGPVGVDLGALRDLEAEFGDIDVKEGTGVRIASAEGGKLTFGKITVGAAPGKQKP